jgi:hypothetical protein
MPPREKPRWPPSLSGGRKTHAQSRRLPYELRPTPHAYEVFSSVHVARRIRPAPMSARRPHTLCTFLGRIKVMLTD